MCSKLQGNSPLCASQLLLSCLRRAYIKHCNAHRIALVQLVELKNGEAYNGRMEACDTWMNMHLREVICTAKDGEKFWRLKEVYIRGNTIKYVRVPEESLGKAVEEKNRRTGASQHRHRVSTQQFRFLAPILC